MVTGQEWIVDAYDCAPELLATPESVRGVCENVIAHLGLHVLGDPHWHQFSPAGVTGLYLLSESHLACHTWPELGTATFNLFCCRPRRRYPWKRCLAEALQAGEIRVRRIGRGRPDSAPTNSSHPKALPQREERA